MIPVLILTSTQLPWLKTLLLLLLLLLATSSAAQQALGTGSTRRHAECANPKS
jgi:hypothetical protein